jgi:hypothetical protein
MGFRTFFACPGSGCKKPMVDVIYLHRNAWRCRKCHGLKYRSQYMPQEQKDAQEYEKLSYEIRAGRLRYQRNSVWEAKVARLQELGSQPKSTRSMRRDQSRLTYTTIYDLEDFHPDDWKPPNDEVTAKPVPSQPQH